MSKKLPWVYQRCEVIRVKDGDTFEVRLDVGFGLSMKTVVRIRNINCEELNGSKAEIAEKAKQFTEQILANASPCTILSYGWDKYGGRINADVILSDGQDLGKLLITKGLAREMK